MGRLLAACQVGAPVSDLLAAYEEAEVPLPPMPVARGLGLGYDLPLVTAALPRTAAEQVIEAGMVLALSAFVWQEGMRRRVRPRAGRGDDDRAGATLEHPLSRPKELPHVTDVDVPPAEEIILYEKDPETRIATITLNRPDQLNIPTIAARRRYADLLFKASIDDDVKVLVVRGVGDHLGTGADLDELMAKRAAGVALKRSSDSTTTTTSPCRVRARTGPGRRSSIGTATPGPAAGPCRTSRRSASSRSRATATAGTSIKRPTPTS